MSVYHPYPFWLAKGRKKATGKNSGQPSTKGPSVIVKEKVEKPKREKPITVKPFGVPEVFDTPDDLMTHEQWRFLTREFRYEQRREHTKSKGWHITTAETAAVLANYLKGKKVLEVASGTGYLAAHMRRLGVEQYTAVDLYINYWEMNSPNYGSIVGDAFEHVDGDYDVIVMAWPPYAAPFGKDIVKRMRPGQTLILQGESWGGCTGSDKMFELLTDHFREDEDVSEELNFKHIQFDGIHDWWTVYHHKGTKVVNK